MVETKIRVRRHLKLDKQSPDGRKHNFKWMLMLLHNCWMCKKGYSSSLKTLYTSYLQVCSHAVEVQAPCPHHCRDPLRPDRPPGPPVPWRLPSALHQARQRRVGRGCWPACELCPGSWWVFKGFSALNFFLKKGSFYRKVRSFEET